MMITINEKAKFATVQFAKDKKAGCISISVDPVTGRTNVCLREILSDANVGDNLTEEEIQKLPKVILKFNCVESVDVLIGALNLVKRNLITPPSPDFALAC